ncbi:MAG: adenosine deaminase [Fimbriimonadaceae bacterium]
MNVGPPTYAELHLHLGGAILPRILYTYLQRAKVDRSRPGAQQNAQSVLRRFPTYERFERRLTRPCATLTQYLEAHKIVEPIQTIESIPYFVHRLLRGAYVFENIAYLELRYCPYFRIPKSTPDTEVRARMEEVVATVAAAAEAARQQFPIQFTQILCLDSRLPESVNADIASVAIESEDEVCALDVAGPEEAYRENLPAILRQMRRAKDAGLKITAHVFETPEGHFPELLDLVDRIGHGIQIPLREPRLLAQIARRGVCLEVCPTTYFRTGTLRTYQELQPVFRHCFDMGVDIAVCTDNSAFHNVRLPVEYERLLTHGVVDFTGMMRLRENAFRHAFRWRDARQTAEAGRL